MSKRLWVCLAMMGLLAAPVFAGVRFTSVTRSEDEGQKGKDTAPVTGKIWIDGDKARFETAQKGSGMPEGYMLTQDAGTTMYMVMAKDKTYMKWDMSMGNAAMKMMNMKYSDPKVETLLEEAGPSILGYPTRHTKFRTSYSTEMSFMGMTRKSSTVQDEDIWATDKFNDRGLHAWGENFAKKMGNEDLDKLIKAKMAKVKGLPLKTVIATTSTDEQGKAQVSHVTTEITEIKEESIAADIFQLPAGYKEMTMPTMQDMPARGARTSRSSVKQAAEEAAADAATEAGEKVEGAAAAAGDEATPPTPPPLPAALLKGFLNGAKGK